MFSDYTAWLTASGFTARTVEGRVQGVRRLMAMAGVDDVESLTSFDVTRYVASVPARESKVAYYHDAATFARFLTAVTGTAPGFLQGVPRPKAKRGTPRPVPAAELAAAMAVADVATSAMLRLAAFAGLRVSEIASVRGEDVGEVIYVRGKGDQDGMIPTHPLIDEIAGDMPRRGWWFPSPRHDVDGHVSRVTVWRYMSEPLRRVGSPATPHQLRHFYGSQLLAGGANLRTVQELLRHSTLATTQVYTRVVDADRKRAIATLALPA